MPPPAANAGGARPCAPGSSLPAMLKFIGVKILNLFGDTLNVVWQKMDIIADKVRRRDVYSYFLLLRPKESMQRKGRLPAMPPPAANAGGARPCAPGSSLPAMLKFI